MSHDDTVFMDIIFQPPQVKSYSVDMCMVSDNCNVKHFSIKGKYYGKFCIWASSRDINVFSKCVKSSGENLQCINWFQLFSLIRHKTLCKLCVNFFKISIHFNIFLIFLTKFVKCCSQACICFVWFFTCLSLPITSKFLIPVNRCSWLPLLDAIKTKNSKWVLSMIRKYHNHKMQKNRLSMIFNLDETFQDYSWIQDFAELGRLWYFFYLYTVCLKTIDH